MKPHSLKIAFCYLFIIFAKESKSDICQTCLCFSTDDSTMTMNCHRAGFSTINTLRFELMSKKYSGSLTTLDLSNNDITSLPLDIFGSTNFLKIVNLSNNLLTILDSTIFQNLKHLETLDLSNNHIEKVNLITFPNLKVLDMSHNSIGNLDVEFHKAFPLLTDLNLSHNNLDDSMNGTLTLLSNMQNLDLASNKFCSFDSEDFGLLRMLKRLNLNHNKVKSLSKHDFSNNLSHLDASFNSLATFSANFVKVKNLDIAFNVIREINPQQSSNQSSELVFLNISGNQLKTLSNFSFHKLKTLDLSYNDFTNIPSTLSEDNYPALKKLVFSGNKMTEIKFLSGLKIEYLIMQDMSLLGSIHADSFQKLRINEGDCINLTVTNNPNLSAINETAFDNLNICFLDLRHNNLSQLQPNILSSGFKAKLGVDLAGNPFHCNCSLQWMLDDLIPWLYSVNRSLLNDLRCATPGIHQGVRMVQWYGWKTKALCHSGSPMYYSQLMSIERFQNLKTVRYITLRASNSMLLILIITGTVLLVLLVLGLILKRKLSNKRKRLNRRF
ncbi:hypothetical protein QAD02_008531 [Eretmocerus hayati]|uniref:Uncharacterized protein n=1 Tax=Eretmocerus hayati TaxID=131215 RepID=A0ACC2N736_9HYME|nr:hypothetical protein QAD02_008531 [Eretmocerus hayati]